MSALEPVQPLQDDNLLDTDREVKNPQTQYALTPVDDTDDIRNLDFGGVDRDPVELLGALQTRQNLDEAVVAFGGDVQNTLRALRGYTGNTLAQAQSLAERQGIPVNQVLSNLPEYQKDADLQRHLAEVFRSKIDPDTGERVFQNPVTLGALFQDPQAKAIFKDDFERIHLIERLVDTEYGTLAGASNDLADTARSIGRAPFQLYAAAKEYQASEALNFYKSAKEEGTTVYTNGGRDALTAADLDEEIRKAESALATNSVYQMAQDIIQSNALRTRPVVESRSFLPQLGRGVVGAAPQYGVAIGLSALGSPAAGATFMGSLTASSQLEQFKAQGIDIETAVPYALGTAVVSSGLEYIGLGKMTRALMTKHPTLWNAAMSGLTATGSEFVTEGSQSLAESIGAIMAEGQSKGEDPIQYLADNFNAQEAFGDAAYEGLIGAVYGTVAATGAISQNIEQRNLFAKDSDFIQELRNWKESLTIKDSGTGQVESLANKVISKSPDAPQVIQFEAEKFLQYFQNDPEGLARTAEELGIADQIDAAMAAGTPIQVKTGTWTAKVAGTDLDAAMSPDQTYRSDGLSQVELDSQVDILQAEIEEATAEVNRLVSDEVIHYDLRVMRETLLQDPAGRSTEQVDAEVLIYHKLAKGIERMSGGRLSYDDAVARMKAQVVFGDDVDAVERQALQAEQARLDQARSRILVEGQDDTDAAPTGSFMKDRYSDLVYVMEELDPRSLLLSENVEGIKDTPEYREYVKLAEEGSTPPPVTVNQSADGSLVAVNRRRVLAAVDAGVPAIRAWVSRLGADGTPQKIQDVESSRLEQPIQQVDPLLEAKDIKNQDWYNTEVSVEYKGEVYNSEAGPLVEELGRRKRALDALLDCIKG